MKKLNSNKGFTLIELLIVIAIIAVLAVAFLPTLLNAPAKGRDTARIATLQKIQKVIINYTLQGRPYPNTAGPIKTDLVWKQVVSADGDTWALLTPDFGGTFPVDPQGKNYYLALGAGPLGNASYNFGLWAQVENLQAGNANCNTASPFGVSLTTPVAAAAAIVPCYAILSQ